MSQDILELLGQANPVTEQDAERYSNPQTLARLVDRILAEPEPRDAPRRPRRVPTRLAVVAAALALIGGGVAAAVALSASSGPVTHAATIECFATASVNASGAVVTASPSPVAACTKLWSHGAVDHEHLRAPGRLTPCVLKTGGIGVFPFATNQSCSNLGLRPANPGDTSRAGRVAALQNALVNAFEQNCLGSAQATAAARTILDQRGFQDWKTATRGDRTAKAPTVCATLAFDEPTRTIIIIPDVRPPRTQRDPRAEPFAAQVAAVIPAELKINLTQVAPRQR